MRRVIGLVFEVSDSLYRRRLLPVILQREGQADTEKESSYLVEKNRLVLPALIIAAAILIAVVVNWYISPFQQCVREYNIGACSQLFSGNSGR